MRCPTRSRASNTCSTSNRRDWKQNKAYEIMTTALRQFEKIDLVYGHNDPMAYGAFSPPRTPAARRTSCSSASTDCRTRAWSGSPRANSPRTFEYPTPGAEGLRQAIKLLKGEKIEKKIVLGTKTITKENAPEILKANGIAI